MRASAEIGIEKMTRSMRVRAREFDEIVDLAEIGKPGHGRPRAVVAAVVERADDADVGVALRHARRDQRGGFIVGADDDGAPVKATLLAPASHHEEQRSAESDQHDHPGAVVGAEPDARELVAGLGEERDADDDEEHHRPGGCEPEILLLVAAESLHLVDVCGLERQCCNGGNREDRDRIVPFEALARDHVAGVDRGADQHHQQELDQADGAGEHDRRIRIRGRLFGKLQRGRRQRARCRGRRFWRRGCAVEHRSGVETEHSSQTGRTQGLIVPSPSGIS